MLVAGPEGWDGKKVWVRWGYLWVSCRGLWGRCSQRLGGRLPDGVSKSVNEKVINDIPLMSLEPWLQG